LLPGRIDQFVVGAAAGALIVSWRQGRRSRIVDALTTKGALSTLLVALLAVGTYHGATWRSGDDGILPLLVHPVAGWLLAGVLVRLTCGSTPRLLVHPALTSLGGVSFSLYLWHYPILRRGLALVHPTQPTGLVVLVAVVLVAAGVAVAALAHELVEQPATRHEQERRARSRAWIEPVMVTHRCG
jgi:peptidoglycan/LPS O-acetylase OafA/YrhL